MPTLGIIINPMRTPELGIHSGQWSFDELFIKILW